MPNIPRRFINREFDFVAPAWKQTLRCQLCLQPMAEQTDVRERGGKEGVFFRCERDGIEARAHTKGVDWTYPKEIGGYPPKPVMK